MNINGADWWMTNNDQVIDPDPLYTASFIGAVTFVRGGNLGKDRIYIRGRNMINVNQVLAGLDSGGYDAGFSIVDQAGRLAQFIWPGDRPFITQSTDDFKWIFWDATNKYIYVASGDVLGGGFSLYDAQKGIARFTYDPDVSADLSYDSSFDSTVLNTGAEVRICTGARGHSGSIYIGGNLGNWGATTIYGNIARIDSTGTLDGSFDVTKVIDGQINIIYNSAYVAHDNRLYVGGAFDTYDGASRSSLMTLVDDGTLDTAFSPPAIEYAGGQAVIYCIHVQGDGKVIAGGVFDHVAGEERNCIARFHPNGALDVTFDAGAITSPSANPVIYTICPESRADLNETIPGGVSLNILVGGFFDSLGGKTRNNVAKLDMNGRVLGPATA